VVETVAPAVYSLSAAGTQVLKDTSFFLKKHICLIINICKVALLFFSHAFFFGALLNIFFVVAIGGLACTCATFD
jgi:hypothetical protein